jgi:hypothetical protein
VAWHQHLTCEQYQALPEDQRSPDDATLVSVAQQMGWKRCPQCRCRSGLATNALITTACVRSSAPAATGQGAARRAWCGSERRRKIKSCYAALLQVLCVAVARLLPHDVPLQPPLLLPVHCALEDVRLRAVGRGPPAERGARARDGAGGSCRLLPCWPEGALLEESMAHRQV